MRSTSAVVLPVPAAASTMSVVSRAEAMSSRACASLSGGVEGVVPLSALLPRLHESRLAKQREMFRHRRTAHVRESLRELTGREARLVTQQVENGPPGRIRDGGKGIPTC